jgi:hypothetical protein
MSATPNMPVDPPDGPPLENRLTAEDYAALQKVFANAELLEDAIQRAHHIGLDVGQHAAIHERNKAIAGRIRAMYPPPAKHPLSE